ncbi:MAG: hypothetical protein AAGL49_02460, partial [Pseudomonadota bacterium]
VKQPFASRVFATILAQWASEAFSMEIRSALAIVSSAGWILAAWPASFILYKSKVPLNWAIVIASVPLPALASAYYLVPDGVAVLFALSCFAGMSLNSRILATLGATLTVLTRNTMALSIVLWTAAASLRRTQVYGLSILFGVAVGAVLLAWMTPAESTNQHQMNAALYILAKVPVNAIRNILGLDIYINTADWCATPQIVFSVSHLPGLGDINELGICSFNWSRTMYTLFAYSTIFGVFPYLVARAILRDVKRGRSKPVKDIALLLSIYAPFTFLFVISPALGITIKRLFVEAYPLIFPLARFVCPICPNPSKQQVAILVCLNIAAVILLHALYPHRSA